MTDTTDRSRRQILQTAPVLAGAAALSAPARADDAAASPGRVLRLAHLTDTHVLPDRNAAAGFASCLAHVQGQADPPTRIVFGGDNLMNVDGEDGPDRAPGELDVWNTVLAKDCGLPHRTVIGNHDILSLDPVDGKSWAVDAFGLSGRYYHWDEAGWRFIVLDSTSPNVLRDGDGGYLGLLDEEQFQWLADTLGATPGTTHVCIVSHIPILAACAYFDGENEQEGQWRVPGAWMHYDARRLKDLFVKHPQVKLCLSGHMHLVDQVDYLGVKYACNGAVSGGWWDGKYHEFGPGYALIDLFENGQSEVEFIDFGWHVPEKTS